MSDVTQLLDAWRGGDSSALDQLIPLVYDDLRRLAKSLSHGRASGSTGGTGLVHELFMRLSGQTHPDIQSRAHFFAVSARAMRQILVDNARRQQAQRRGGGVVAVSIEDVDAGAPDRASELLDLHEGLNRLAELYPRRAQVIELRYFGGLSAEETAEALGVSTETARREARMGEAWLGELLGPGALPL